MFSTSRALNGYAQAYVFAALQKASRANLPMATVDLFIGFFHSAREIQPEMNI
jgi:hypothetical protein